MSSKTFLEMLKASGVKDLYLDLPKKEITQAQPSKENKGLSELKKIVLPCTQCTELAGTRKSVVFGSGNPHADLMFVGEAPGAEEDIQGLPF